MGMQWGSTNAERRRPSTRSTSTGAGSPGATSRRVGFLAWCQAVLAGPSARELGRDRLAIDGRAPHLAALERVHDAVRR